MDLGFLQPDHIRLMLLDQRRQLMGAGAQPLMLKETIFMVGCPGKTAMLADMWEGASVAVGQMRC